MVLPVVLQMMLYGVHVDVVVVQRALGIGAVKHGVSPSPGVLLRMIRRRAISAATVTTVTFSSGAQFSWCSRFGRERIQSAVLHAWVCVCRMRANGPRDHLKSVGAHETRG